MSNVDVIYWMREARFSQAARVGVSQSGRDFSGQRSTYYRACVKQWGLDALRPRAAEATDAPPAPPWVEERSSLSPGLCGL